MGTWTTSPGSASIGPSIHTDDQECHHTSDFSKVTWYGTEYHFNETQAKCVSLLWREWEEDSDGKPTLHQRTIRDNIGSDNADFRLAHVFRLREGGGMHPAWKGMIHGDGKGLFYLAEPTVPVQRRKVSRKRKTKHPN